MNLKFFIIASITIHVVGGVALYFYYNPIALPPQPISFEGEDGSFVEDFNKKINGPEGKPSPETVKNKPRLEERKATVAAEGASLDGENLALKKAEAPILQPENPALEEAKGETQETEEPVLETKESPVKLDLVEMAGLNKEDSRSTQKVGEPFPEEEVSAQDQPALQASENLEDYEEESASLEAISVQNNKQQKIPENLEDYEEVDAFLATASAQNNKQQKIPEDLEDYEEVEEEPQEFPGQESTPKRVTLKPAQAGLSSSAQERSNTDNAKPEIKDFARLKQKPGNPPLSSYPDFARRQGMEGTVSVLFFVTEQGLVDKIQLESSSGHRELDNFVLRVLGRYEFLNNEPSWVRHKIKFALEGEEQELLRLREEVSQP